MVPAKTARARHSDIRLRPPLSLSPARSGGLIRSLAISEAMGEEELLEQIGKICLEYCQRDVGHVRISGYQVLPPEAVSLIEPPERVWLVRLHIIGPEQEQPAGEVEVIAVLQGGEVSVIFR